MLSILPAKATPYVVVCGCLLCGVVLYGDICCCLSCAAGCCVCAPHRVLVFVVFDGMLLYVVLLQHNIHVLYVC